MDFQFHNPTQCHFLCLLNWTLCPCKLKMGMEMTRLDTQSYVRDSSARRQHAYSHTDTHLLNLPSSQSSVNASLKHKAFSVYFSSASSYLWMFVKEINVNFTMLHHVNTYFSHVSYVCEHSTTQSQALNNITIHNVTKTLIHPLLYLYVGLR